MLGNGDKGQIFSYHTTKTNKNDKMWVKPNTKKKKNYYYHTRKRDLTTDFTDNKRIIRKDYEWLYSVNLTT